MAEKLAELRQKGGGSGTPVASGTFTRGSTAITITCGFRPKKIFIIHDDNRSSATVPNGALQFMYDSDWSTTLIVANYKGTNGTSYVQKQALSSFFTLSDTGFTIVGTTTGYQGTCYYTAIGE